MKHKRSSEKEPQEAFFERGCHPADPDGEVFGDTHWPLPNVHEISGIAIGSFQRRKHHQEESDGS